MHVIFAVHDFFVCWTNTCGYKGNRNRNLYCPLTWKFVFSYTGIHTFFLLSSSSPGWLCVVLPLLCLSDTGTPQAEGGSAGSDEDSEVEVVYVREPTAEQAALARELLLPHTFFCYKNEPGYTSDDQTDGEAEWWESITFLSDKKQQKVKIIFLLCHLTFRVCCCLSPWNKMSVKQNNQRTVLNLFCIFRWGLRVSSKSLEWKTLPWSSWEKGCSM